MLSSSRRIDDLTFETWHDPAGQHILEFRYLQRAPSGEYERPVELFRRVAKNLAKAEEVFTPTIDPETEQELAERFFLLMTDGKFLPNAPTLLGAGGPSQQLHACVLLPIEDSIDAIFEAVRKAAVVHSRGAGTGFCISKIRERNSPIMTGGCATGPVSFLKVFDAETDVIKHGGTGWGANMAVLRCDHPDVLEFVDAKSSAHSLTNFNISVGITDGFMACFERNEVYGLKSPRTGEVVRTIQPKELMGRIAQRAWANGDPGLLFLDRINRDNPTPGLGPIEATNPCAEAPLLPYESCCLGGINVLAHIHESESDLDWYALRETCSTALRMMDNTIEMSRYPLPEVQSATMRTRKVGIGIMGFADALLRLGISYSSEAAEGLARRVMREIRTNLTKASELLADERGAFPAFHQSCFSNGRPRRNATTTANAPNSTISLIAGCSAGIEPLFSLVYRRITRNGEVTVANSEVKRLLRIHPTQPNTNVRRAEDGESNDWYELPEDLRDLCVTAHDISAEWHLRIQAAVQENTELGVAKTINLPNSAGPDDVQAAFVRAHALGCKGITCYREGSREQAFLSVGHRPDTASLSAK
ncbi:MAG: adenosylcobalamin-dependent ribonucleoside-diphosphate reductase [Xanthobacteraceae bacterium]